MIAFVIPVKPKFNSKDWGNDNALLSRTLKSICNQTNSGFLVYVVYHDLPELTFDHPNIKFIQYPFSYLNSDSIEDLEDYALKYYSRKYAEYMFDKGKKITFGCDKAKRDGCNFIMAVDSDDLVSNKIAKFVNSSSASKPGWVIEKGYIYLENSKFLIKSKLLQGINGSTHIINSNLVPIPDLETNRLFDFNFFESHGYLRTRIQQLYNMNLETLPFYGAIYIVHKFNSSAISDLVTKFKIKTYLKYLIFGKLLDSKTREEFSLYNV
ncbi:hypothetical protein [Pontibacter sp. SGAir0037]|uniref:hypothetical protein n=1 Tax=Pontibacter sp. SGAir0037 TaxID=2571030 RepID=UPI0010CD1585|nr:hypothetical protein [Pontibacter sp. SGAir0037]QCR22163.1 hypothetical protein C1N53_07295 [Pontibacter sp. SGAir0037]